MEAKEKIQKQVDFLLDKIKKLPLETQYKLLTGGCPSDYNLKKCIGLQSSVCVNHTSYNCSMCWDAAIHEAVTNNKNRLDRCKS